MEQIVAFISLLAGLLANLWEFPSLASQPSDDSDESSELTNALNQSKGLLAGRAIERFQYVADVYHQFSHISQTYGVYHVVVSACEGADDADLSLPDHYQGFKWLGARQIAKAAIATAMKKVFRAFTQNADATGPASSAIAQSSSSSSTSSSAAKRKAKSKATGSVPLNKKQMTLQSFFVTKREAPDDETAPEIEELDLPRKKKTNNKRLKA